jgi:hypothetical protein
MVRAMGAGAMRRRPGSADRGSAGCLRRGWRTARRVPSGLPRRRSGGGPHVRDRDGAGRGPSLPPRRSWGRRLPNISGVTSGASMKWSTGTSARSRSAASSAWARTCSVPERMTASTATTTRLVRRGPHLRGHPGLPSAWHSRCRQPPVRRRRRPGKRVRRACDSPARLASRQGLGQFGGPLLAGRCKRDLGSLTFISVLLTASAPRAAARFARSGYRRCGVQRAAHHRYVERCWRAFLGRALGGGATGPVCRTSEALRTNAGHSPHHRP